MTSTKPLTASERYARFILSAWSKREFNELQVALTQSPLTRPENLPPVECERMDLIHDLGQNLLAWENSGQVENGTDQNAALGLVRHLARCE
jgi:hypothetical protein